MMMIQRAIALTALAACAALAGCHRGPDTGTRSGANSTGSDTSQSASRRNDASTMGAGPQGAPEGGTNRTPGSSTGNRY